MLRVVVLGAAAGGGVPQWNCGCAVCRTARGDHPELQSTQASIAVSGDGAEVLSAAKFGPDLVLWDRLTGNRVRTLAGDLVRDCALDVHATHAAATTSRPLYSGLDSELSIQTVASGRARAPPPAAPTATQ